MKVFFKSFTIIWLALLLSIVVMGFVSIPQEIEGDNKYIATELEPAIAFIRNYQNLNNRLPTTREFYTWEIDTYPTKSNIENVNDTIQVSYIQYFKNYQEQPTISGLTREEVASEYPWNYTLELWSYQDWFGYYDSKTTTYRTDKTPWKDQIFSTVIICIIGYLSVRFWLVKYWRNNTFVKH